MLDSWRPLDAVWQEGMGRDKLARIAGCHPSTAKRFLKWKKGQTPTPPDLTPKAAAASPPPAQNVSVEYASDKASITTISCKITNLDEALAAAKVDLSRWEVSRHVINHYDVSAKNGDGFTTITNFQIKVWLQPRAGATLHQVLNDLITDIAGKGPQKAHYSPLVRSDDPHMLEISLMDHHFGKLAWKPETGSDYDLKIAAELYANAVYDLVQRAKTFGVEKILLPIGQDFFNIDNNANMTAGGTPQDCDGRLAKIYEVGCRSVLDAIDLAASVAEVEVIWVPGNHDTTTSYYLCKYVEAWYRNSERVTVNAAPSSRKYVPYGVNLIGFTHNMKMDSLPLLMMSENRDNLVGIKHCEWHTGHLHKVKEMKFVAGDTFGPVIVRILPSLSGTDKWHYEHSFTCGVRAAEAYLWSKRNGYVGHFSAVGR